jgi:hypothetical protein
VNDAARDPYGEIVRVWIRARGLEGENRDGVERRPACSRLRSCPIDGGFEPVAATWQSLDIERSLGGIAQGFPQAIDGIVDAMIEVDEGVRRPNSPLQLVALDYLSGLLQENLKDLKRLFLKPDLGSVSAQFSRVLIQFKLPEPYDGL